jgi:hypothetical protein
MRIFSYVYHGLLALFLLAISSLALVGGTHTIHIDFLPWQGASLTYWLFFSALFGLITIVLAVKGILRGLFFLWSLVILVVLVKGFFLSPHVFEPGEWKTAALITLGALVAVAGAWFRLRQARDRWSRQGL